MMEHSSEQFDIRSLLIRLVENDVGGKERTVIVRWLEETPGAVEAYCDFLKDYALIRLLVASKIDLQPSEDSQFDKAVWAALKEMEETAPSLDINIELPSRQPCLYQIERPITSRQNNKRSLATVILSVAAMLLFAAIIHVLPSRSSRPVASLSSSVNTRWSGAGETLPDGSRLWNDGRSYTLERGVSKIIFDGGATVFVEAPSRLQVFNENELVFVGSMTAHVPKSAQGFTVHTPTSTVVDLGTEFGLLATAKDSQVHVLKGYVELKSAAPKTYTHQRIHAKEGYRITESGVISEVPFATHAFRWELPDVYEQSVYKTNPVSYWRFNRDTPERMINEMDVTSVNGYYHGLVLLGVPGPNLGNDRPNHALGLRGLQSGAGRTVPFGYAVIDDKNRMLRQSGAYSTAMWIYAEDYGTQSIFVYSEDEPGTVEVLGSYSDQIYLDKDGRVSFYVYCSESAETNDALHSISMTETIQLNRWYHVVAGYSSDGKMALYVNGRLEVTTQLPSRPQTNRFGYIGTSTGNPFFSVSDNDRWTRESFRGRIDEISQYDRLLTAEEVRFLYEAATGIP